MGQTRTDITAIRGVDAIENFIDCGSGKDA
jgi:hypothetical protein